MALKDVFNNQYQARRENDYVLSLYYGAQAGSMYITFDFLTRTMITRTGSSDGGVAVTPFSQLDRDVVIQMRDTLIELKGNPPELPPEAPATQASAKKLNL